MFRIIKYHDKSYCAEHPTIEFETEPGLILYTVFATVQVKNNDTWYRFVTASDEADYMNKITTIKQIALYATSATPPHGQQLLTLSTCYSNNKSDRLIVIAVEEKQYL